MCSLINMFLSGLMAIDSLRTNQWKTAWPPSLVTEEKLKQKQNIRTKSDQVILSEICKMPLPVYGNHLWTPALSIKCEGSCSWLTFAMRVSFTLPPDMDTGVEKPCGSFHICHLRHILNIPPANSSIRWEECKLPSWMHCFNQNESRCRFNLGLFFYSAIEMPELDCVNVSKRWKET